MKNRIFIASDHAGIEFKAFCKDYLEKKGCFVEDLGPYLNDRVDYPDFAKLLCKKVLENQNTQGFLICGSGIGMSMTANRFKGIRAALCHDAYTAHITRAHNDANVLCLGARTTGLSTAESIIDAWLESKFEGGRHSIRIEKIEIE